MIASTAPARSRLLVVDDDAEMREALSLFFTAEGHDCELAADAMTALGVVRNVNVDAVDVIGVLR